MDTFLKAIGGLVVFIGIIALLAALIGLPVMWLWNSTVPQIFALKAITFWQSVRLAFLCGLLFKSTNTTKDK